MELYLQTLFYDKPRVMHELYQQVSNINDLHQYLRAHPQIIQSSIIISRIQLLESVKHVLSQSSIDCVLINDDRYPSRFHMLHDPPLCLFYQGDIQSMSCQPFMGVVGTRRPSMLAKRRTEYLIGQLSQCGIISGGALGIDAFAHEAAILSKLPTACIQACGLDQWHPKTNHHVFKAILESKGGCIVSECPPGVHPKPYLFPQRNRLIAAASNGVLVVEATQKSGAVITANLAAHLGVTVGAVTGGFNAPKSMGCYDLMQDGAMVIGNDEQYQSFIEESFCHIHASTAALSHDNWLTEVPVEPIHIEELAQVCNIDVADMIDRVTASALNGDVMMLPGQMVCRCD